MEIVVYFEGYDFVVETSQNDYEIVEVFKDHETGESAERSVAQITRRWSAWTWRNFNEALVNAKKLHEELSFGGD